MIKSISHLQFNKTVIVEKNGKVVDKFGIYHDSAKNVCEVFNQKGLINNTSFANCIHDIVKILKNNLPKNCIIWTGFIGEHEYDAFIKAGFSEPYLSDVSPLKKVKSDKEKLSFLQYNKEKAQKDTAVVHQKIHYIKNFSFPNFCKMYAQFTKTAVQSIRQLVPENGKFELVSVKNPSHELTGSFFVKSVKKIKDKTVFRLDVDISTIESGKEEEVEAVWSRFNFHTHPKKAYENSNVKKGWPSSSDYVGFLDLQNHTIFHTVVTLEGVYVISISPECTDDKTTINRKFVLKHCHIDHSSAMSCEDYVHHINSVIYKDKKLFYIKLLRWSNIETTIFDVYYSKTDQMCLSTDDIFNICLDLKRRLK